MAERNPILMGTAEIISADKIALEGKFIRIIETSLGDDRKTLVFRVDNKDCGEIAYISFYPKWRKYVFEPLNDTVFEEVCLREIADFIEAQTKQWRQSKRVKRGD